MLTDEQLQSLYKLAWVNRPVEGFIEEARAYLSASAAPAEGREAVDDVASLVDEWIRSRGTSMDGESYAAAVQLAAFIKTRPATAPQAATTAGAVDERAAFTRLQRDYDSLKSLCANAEVTAAEAQAELKKARAALATAPTKATTHIDVVFDGPPSAQAPRFVECEDSNGKSINVGEWVRRDDGYWVLRIGTAPTKPTEGQVRAITDWPGYWIDGQKVSPQDYIVWLLRQLEATEAVRLPEQKYYGTQDGDGDQHEVKCAYVDGWNACRKAMPTTAQTMSEGAGEIKVADVILTGAQLLEALEFIAPDRATDPEQLKSEVAIQYGEGHSGKAYYVWCAEYLEEGSFVMDGSSAIEAHPASEPITDAAREFGDKEARRICEIWLRRKGSEHRDE
ncbi:MAG: hypothetical protein ACTHKE_11770 [Sphingomicrobium sp.]